MTEQNESHSSDAELDDAKLDEAELDNGFDIQEILELLPHRYPMLLVDKVFSYVPGKSLHALKNITFNEPVFTGHFPEKAIFPGVLILEALAQATGLLGFKMVKDRNDKELYLFAGVDKARFRQQVVPGDSLHLHVELVKEKRGIWKFHGEAKVDGKLACTAELTLARVKI
ncbi:MAG: 3-hydroxyacyl-[acyl-carrier-protein] dehydratase [Phenylobacterium sp.]|jgi:3-hydroxyacyl-[acyl-carrier-protein] dehydratase